MPECQLLRTRPAAALDRVFKLAVSLPDVPLIQFLTKTRQLPKTTEAERLAVQRIGQDIFRDALRGNDKAELAKAGSRSFG